MNLIEKRKDNAKLIAEKRFIKKVLEEQGNEMKSAQTKVMRDNSFQSSKFFNKRRFNVSNDTMIITNLKLHRFVDMKTRKTKSGVKRKKSHPIYNRIIFGHLNNIIRQISFGFTDSVIEEMKKLED